LYDRGAVVKGPDPFADYLVQSVTNKPLLTTFKGVVDAVLPCVLHALSHREVAVAFKLDFGEVDDQRIFDTVLGEGGEGHVVLVHIHTNNRP
jgi:hypothetical protein